jgi:hypothetical protein
VTQPSAFALHPIYSVHLWEGATARVWSYWRFDKAMAKFREGVGNAETTEAMVYRHAELSGKAIGLIAIYNTRKETIIYGIPEQNAEAPHNPTQPFRQP